jgi:C4-type Zn-finger protein
MNLRCWFWHKRRVYDVIEVPERRATVYEWVCERCGYKDAEVGFWD